MSEISQQLLHNMRGRDKFTGSAHIRGPRWAQSPLITSMFFGTQLIWSVEMAYEPKTASPYLNSLGLTKAETALVFIAAPLSGLIVQPLIGAFTDHSTARFGRRRPTMLIGCIICALSMLSLSWASNWGAFAVPVAIISFYFIDFSINAIIAVDRALVVDTLPTESQEEANLWTSRAVGLGALTGFFVGHLDLGSIPILNLLGKTQLQILSALVAITLLGFHSFVSSIVTERVLLSEHSRSNWRKTLSTLIYHALRLPGRIKTVCWILFFSWIGWFPFMFFGSLWIRDIYLREHKTENPSNEEAARAASQSLMWHAMVAFITSLVLPIVISRRKLSNSRVPLLEETHPNHRWLRPDLVSVWVSSHVVFSICMFSTSWVSSYSVASILFATLGFPSALLHWAPFTLLGEAILSSEDIDRDPINERSPLISAANSEEGDSPLAFSEPAGEVLKDKPGILLGIANVFVVTPQFIIVALSAIIFAIFEPNRSVIPGVTGSSTDKHVDSIAIVFGIGAFSALIALYFTLKLR